MPTIRKGEALPNVPWQITTLPRLLRELGLPVPEPLESGLAKARWTVPAPDLEARKAAVLAADTPESYADAVVAYATAMADLKALGAGGEIETVLKHFTYNAAASGLVASMPDIFDSLITAFVETGAEFTEKLSAIPEDMVLDIRHEGFDASLVGPMQEAKHIAGRMTEIVEAYNNVMMATAQTANLIRLNESTGIVRDIAEFPTELDEMNAAHDIERYKLRQMQGIDGELLPWAPIVRAGGCFVVPNTDAD